MPIALSTATASVSSESTSDDTLNSDKTGFVDMPEVSGYYVIFDKSTVLDKNVDANGIKISGRGGLAYEGEMYFQPNCNRSKTPVIPADYDLSTWPGIGGNSPLYVRGGYLNC